MMVPVFASPLVLLQGLFFGLLIGFLFQKGGLSEFRIVIGQFLLKNFTMLKIVGTAIVVTSGIFYVLYGFGALMSVPVEPVLASRVIVGGMFMGVGMALLGYCPASALAAIGQGARDALFGVLGMIVGVFIFHGLYPWLMQFFPGEPAGIMLNTLVGLQPLWLIGVLILISGALFYWLERCEGCCKR